MCGNQFFRSHPVSSSFMPNDKQQCLRQVSGASSTSSCEFSGPACCDRERANAGSVLVSEPMSVDGNGVLVYECVCVCLSGYTTLCGEYSIISDTSAGKSKCLIHFKLRRMCVTGQDRGMCPRLS